MSCAGVAGEKWGDLQKTNLGLREGLRDPGTEVERCGARTFDGPCQELPVPGKRRCRLHGGLSTGPRTRRGHARCLAGRVRSYERSDEIRRQIRNEMDARGGATALAAPDPQVLEAQRLVSRELAILTGDDAHADWLGMGNADRLNALTRLSLTKALEILALRPEPGDLKLLAIQKDLATGVISQQIRVDEAKFREQREETAIAELLRRLEEHDRKEGERRRCDIEP